MRVDAAEEFTDGILRAHIGDGADKVFAPDQLFPTSGLGHEVAVGEGLVEILLEWTGLSLELDELIVFRLGELLLGTDEQDDLEREGVRELLEVIDHEPGFGQREVLGADDNRVGIGLANFIGNEAPEAFGVCGHVHVPRDVGDETLSEALMPDASTVVVRVDDMDALGEQCVALLHQEFLDGGGAGLATAYVKVDGAHSDMISDGSGS